MERESTEVLAGAPVRAPRARQEPAQGSRSAAGMLLGPVIPSHLHRSLLWGGLSRSPVQRDRSAHIHTWAFQSPGRHLDALFHRHGRHGHSQVLYFLGKTEMNTGDKHISWALSVTTESWHRAKEGSRVRKHKTSLVQTATGLKASVEQSEGSGRAFVSAAIAGVWVWAPHACLHLHAAQLSLEMGSDLPGLDAPRRALVSHCSGQNHQRPQHLRRRTSAVLHCQMWPS